MNNWQVTEGQAAINPACTLRFDENGKLVQISLTVIKVREGGLLSLNASYESIRDCSMAIVFILDVFYTAFSMIAPSDVLPIAYTWKKSLYSRKYLPII